MFDIVLIFSQKNIVMVGMEIDNVKLAQLLNTFPYVLSGRQNIALINKIMKLL